MKPSLIDRIKTASSKTEIDTLLEEGRCYKQISSKTMNKAIKIAKQRTKEVA